MIDLHCHLDLYPDPRSVAEECIRRGLYILSVTTTPSAWAGTLALANGNKRICTALGLHPQLAKEREFELPLFDEILPTTKYVGEIGLDGSPECKTYWKNQIKVFEHILKSCSDSGGKILSIHSRRASRQVIDLLAANQNAGIPILHWYSGNFQDLERAINLGCWFSVGPAMLRSSKGKELLARMPADRVLTETDGPFATINNAPLMPWDVENVNPELEEIWGITQDNLKNTLDKNLKEILSLI